MSKERRLEYRVTESGCHEVTSHKPSTQGYPVLRRNGRTVKAHRYTFECEVGPIPEGMCVLHRCDNRLCVNPAHLWLGTRADNSHDMVEKGRERHKKGEDLSQAKLTEADVRAIREAYASGLTQEQVAVAFGTDQTNVSLICRGENWRHVSGVLPSMRPRVKLTAENVRAIRKAFASGVLQKKLALEFGIDASSVSNVCTGKTWRQVK